MAVLVYRTFTLDVLETRQCDRQTRYSEDKVDMLWEDWTIAVSATYNRGVPGTQNPTSAALNDVAIRHALMTPHGALTFSVFGVSAPGAAPALQTLLSVPEANDATGGANPCDADNGPTPVYCTVTKIVGDATTFMVEYVIKASVIGCPPANEGDVRLTMISNRWEMRETTDATSYMTSRIVKGRAVFNVGELRGRRATPDLAPPNAVGLYADLNRTSFLFPIPIDFKRMLVDVTASPDGTSIDYMVVDEEQPIQMNAASGVSTTTFNQIASIDVAYGQAYQHPRYAGGIANTLNSVANFQWAKQGTPLRWEGSVGLPASKVARFLGRVGAVGALAVGIADALSPTYEDEVTVSVTGNKYATKKRLLQAALSIVYGIIPNDHAGVVGTGQRVIVTYNMMARAVSVTYGMSYGALENLIGVAIDFATATGAGYRSMLVAGVSDLVVGQAFPFAVGPGEESLPDNGSTMLAVSFKGAADINNPNGTTRPSTRPGIPLTNPFPPGDGQMSALDQGGFVGSYLIQMITQALNAPCNTPGASSPINPGAMPQRKLPGYVIPGVM